MLTFKELGLKQEIIQAITELGYVNPTPIQEKVIPYMLFNKGDMVGLAQTGTGKTAAFGLPVLNMLKSSENKTQMLVLAPTRELCVQISNDLKSYSLYIKNLKVVPVYGGENIVTQFRKLDDPPQVLIATPGRLIDLIKRNKVSLSSIDYLVLDEADEMLNMGFLEDIEFIFKNTPEIRRTMLFSATMPKEIESIARKYMKYFEEISVGKRNSGADNVEHIYYMVHAKQRYLALKRIVDLNPDIYGIIFCRTRQETKDIAEHLMRDGYNVDALHGDLSQMQRDSVMQKFRIKNIQLLVATDVAARGLDVSDLTHIINYNLPDDNDCYTHRSGRTGRANKNGISISIINCKEQCKIKKLERMINKKFEQKAIPNGLEVCKKQLFFLVDKMEKVQINEEQIEPFMPSIYLKLNDMPKEELIKRFVSTEFNRFLEYYQDAVDLDNIIENDEKKGGKKRNQVRVKCNKGKKHGISVTRLLNLIKDVTNNDNIQIGDIEITPKFSFFDVSEDQANILLEKFADLTDIELFIIERRHASKAYDNGNYRKEIHGREKRNRETYNTRFSKSRNNNRKNRH